MANDRNRREDGVDYRGADPERQSDRGDEAIRGDDVRGVVHDEDDEFEETEELDEEEDSDE